METQTLPANTEKVLPWVIAISFFMQMLSTTILNTALPSIAIDLNESPIGMQSVVISYMLTVATLMPLSGWVADRFGVKKVFIFANAVFVLGSVFCMFSSSLLTLVLARIVQGVGGSFLMPVGRLAVLRVYPRERLTDVLSFISVPALLGPLLGPTIGGVIVQFSSWQWIFFINIPVGILAIYFTYKFMPMLKMNSPSFDFIGFILIALAVLLGTLGIEASVDLHLPLRYTAPLMALGVILVFLYVFYAKRAPHPLFDLGVFKIKSFSVGIVGNVCARLASGVMPFMTPLLLQVGLGFPPFVSGMLLMPMGLMAIFGKGIVSRILKRVGHRFFLMVNTVLLGILMSGYALIGHDTPMWWLVAQLCLFGIVNSMQFTAMFTITLVDLTPQYAATGNSILSIITQLSMGISVGVGASILAFFAGGTENASIDAFHYTYLSIGAINIIAAIIFTFAPKETGKFPVLDKQRGK